MKFVIIDLCHVTKMAAMSIYGKTLKRLSPPETKSVRLMTMKLAMQHRKYIQITTCLKPRSNSSDIFKG